MRQGGGRSGGTSASTWLAALLIVASGLHFFGNNVADPDLWGHLRYGQTIWRDHAVPRVDVFSYTAAGTPFFDHEWLSDALFAWLFAIAGSASLLLLKLLLSAATVCLILDAARTLGGESPRELARGARGVTAPEHAPSVAHPLTVAAVLIPVFAVMSPGIEFRPQIFTIVLLAVEGALLARADRRLQGASPGWRISWELAVLPLVLGVWANLHGGFLVGLGMLGVFAAARIGRALRGRLRAAAAREPSRAAGEDTLARRDVALLALVCMSAVAAPLMNPYGIALYRYLAGTLGMHDQISEWYPVTLVSLEFLRFKILVLATGVAVGLLWARRPPGTLLPTSLDWRVPLFALAALCAFRHQRHTVLFAVIVAPLLIVAAERARRLAIARNPALVPRRPVFALAALGACAVAIFQVADSGGQLRRDGFAIRFGRLDYPVDAVEFLRTNGIHGNIAMPFEWGAYGIFKLAPESRVFIDGRFEALFPPRVIDDYFTFVSGAPGWEKLLDDYPTDVVVVQRSRNIHPRLFTRSDLIYVYSDPAALVFVRRTPTNAAALAHLVAVPDRTAFARPDTVFP